MLPPDRGTRNLLPILIEKPDEIVRAADDDGGHVHPGAEPEPSVSPASAHGIDPTLPSVGLVHHDSGAAAPANPLPPAQSPAAHVSSPSIEAGSVEVDGSMGHAGISMDGGQSGSGGGSAHGGSSGAAHTIPSLSDGGSPQPTDISEPDDDRPADPHDPAGIHEPEDQSANSVSPASSTDPAVPSEVPVAGGIPLAVPDGDDIHIVQTAFVDQDAEVLLNGWTGESKVRVFMDNDADMAQDVDIDLDVDGNARMFLRLGQSMVIDQETEIDLDIYEVRGVLYVDLHLKNEVDIEQDTELDLMMDGWNGGSQFFVDNDLDVRQHTDVDVDIDDELEEKFAIKVAIGIKQLVDVDQDADIDVSYHEGAFGIDVDATQTALIDQDTTLKIDFSVV